ncbi:hypothetical protein G7Y89_g9626 [Cudoniella acicularis]|uniref:Uncharacterized protein n=1 Tax=Cudoniella acicularis TaxID=354080 RepID=A0A8H4RGL0_9HELO|nr:hypothetical protein G7Y89_g9626 [Cudoniella acicularis]
MLLLLTGFETELGNVFLPSWVPNLNSVSTPRNTINGHFSATNETKPQFSISEDNRRLLISVAIIDTVLECSTIPTWQPGTSSTRIEDSLLMNLEEGYQQTVYAFQTWVWIPFTQGYKTHYDKNPD